VVDCLIELRRADLGYGKHAVLQQLDLRFRAGIITAILGDNGSGKTTLVNAIAGFNKPLGGEITDTSELRIGFVPQEESLDGNYLLSGFEVAAMGAFGRITPGVPFPKAEIEFVSECLVSTHAESFADQQFGRLSGGQKQRILIARALVSRPQLLLLDEPTSGVDTKTTQEVMETIREIQEREKLTVIMVTHDFGLVRKFATEVVWLCDQGCEQGPVNELLSREHVVERLGLA
jgi:ABC-type Mn2+/Zn2+ transport system ATPase subunit